VTRLDAPVYLLKGDDEIVLRDAVRELVRELVGDGDHSLMVEELAGDEYEMAALVDAAQTPPFLTDRRVVLGRGLQRFDKAEVDLLIAYLDDPLPTTTLVLDWSKASPSARGKAAPKPLLTAVQKVGGEHIDVSPGRNLGEWVDQHAKAAAVHLDQAARKRIADSLGEDVSRLAALLDMLESTYGAGARLGVEDVSPYLGEAGGVPPWDLTDAIDRGDIPAAIVTLHRLLGGGERHPFVVLSTLQTHFGRMLRLDGADVAGEKEAAQLLGMKGSTFPARKALGQGRKLGHDRLVDAIDRIAEADLALRGMSSWPPELVLEVLVARLARLSRR
jgi:DNA polymerase-3 subunit delta